MPRNTPVGRGRDAPVAVVKLVGSYDALYYGGWGNVKSHILGNPGPRGGRRTLCNRPARNDWYERPLDIPAHGYRPGAIWRTVCDTCKTGLGTGLNA